MSSFVSGVEGKVVLVTGASSGIGEATARLLAARGAKVVLAARRADKLETIVAAIRAAGGAAEARTLDVTDRESVAAAVAFAVERFGRLDVLVNNAGVMPLSALDKLRVDEWDRTIDVNVKGVLYGIAAALPVFKQQGSGHVVNVSSIGGQTTFPTAVVYCATKFAVRAISDGLRQETTTVRVTNVSPGTTASDLAASTVEPEAAAWLAKFRDPVIPAEAVARAVAFAVEQPAGVNVSEITVRPTASPY